MGFYAGVCETDITPPPGVEMSGYGYEPQRCVGVHDPLYARALVVENGEARLALVAADLLGMPVPLATEMRDAIATRLGIPREAVMLHFTHTHGGPNVGIHPEGGCMDGPYMDILGRKLAGAAQQAAEALQAAHLTYGEASAQIGVNRRKTLPGGSTVLGPDYGGTVVPTVQTLCVNGADGRLFALLFSHACHPTTMGGENRYLTAEWPGAAVAHLKARFAREASDVGVCEDALPICLQGCAGDINPLRRGSWQAMEDNGRQIGEAAHTARWNAHGRLAETLQAREATLALPARTGENTIAFPIQHFYLGGIHLLGFPAEMFAQYQRDICAQSPAAVLTLAYTNGCVGYMPTAAEYARGGYEVDDAYRYYRQPMPGPDSEALIRAAVYDLLDLEDPDLNPYPARHP